MYLDLVFGRPCEKNGSPYATRPLSVLSVLSVTLAYCGQTVGRIKMKLGIVGMPRLRRHCVRWGPNSPSPKRGQSPTIFSLCLLCPHGWMDQDATCYGGRLDPSDIVLDEDQLLLSKNGAEPPNFRPLSIVAKRLDGSRCHLVGW